MARSTIRTGQEVMIAEGAGERIIGRRVRIAHATFKGEHQIAEYVARLETGDRGEVTEAYLREGPTIDEILDLAEEIDADLMVASKSSSRR